LGRERKAGASEPNFGSGTPSFSVDTAVKTGRAASMVRLDVTRATRVTPEAIEAIKGTALDKGVVLDKLAALPAERQVAAVAELRAAKQAEPEPAYEPRGGGFSNLRAPRQPFPH
jgi:hypothetical protein